MPANDAPPPGLDSEVASATARVAWKLFVRYTPVYAALALLLGIAAGMPSRVAEVAGARATTIAAPRATVPPAATAPTPRSSPPVTASSPTTTASVPALQTSGDGLATPSTPLAPAAGATSPVETVPAGDAGDAGGFVSGDQPNTGGAGFSGAGSAACPVSFGQDPQVSRTVAGTLLAAASPALSLLGPLGPNAVPALGLASPVLPVLAPAVDAVSGYIRLFNPLFLQISKGATQLWDGPLAPLEGPLLQLNATVIQPFEVQLLGALSPVLDAVNATPLTPCLQRLVYNVVAPLPIPKAPVP